MAYYYPQGYSGPYHDYYTYDDFIGDLPDASSGLPKNAYAYINGVSTKNILGGKADLSGVYLKPRRFSGPLPNGSRPAILEDLANEDFFNPTIDSIDFSQITSWNSGWKSVSLLTPEHVISTRHGLQSNGTDRGFGTTGGGGSILQFMERNGATFNVALKNPGTGLSFGAGCDPGGDAIIFELESPIVGKDVQYYNRFYAGSTKGKQPGSGKAGYFMLFSQNTLSFKPAGNWIIGTRDRFMPDAYNEPNRPLNNVKVFGCDSGSTTFVVHKDEGTLLCSEQFAGWEIGETTNLDNINTYLNSQGYDGITLVYDSAISDNWYNFYNLQKTVLGTGETITLPDYTYQQKIQVTIVGTDASGRKTKPVTKILDGPTDVTPPPNLLNPSKALLSVNPLSDHFYCSPGIDGNELDFELYGSVFIGYTMDGHPRTTDFGGTYSGAPNIFSVTYRFGSTLDSNENNFTVTPNTGFYTSPNSTNGALVASGGNVFGVDANFIGCGVPAVFPSEVSGLTVYARPSIGNVVGNTLGEWYELGQVGTAGRGSTFTSFSFDNYGPTAGSTMIGTATGYTAIPETGTNKVSGLFGLGGLTITDVRINGRTYDIGAGVTFSGPTFALKIPSDCPTGASLGILGPSSIKYINPYELGDAGVVFPGQIGGVTYINVGGS